MPAVSKALKPCSEPKPTTCERTHKHNQGNTIGAQAGAQINLWRTGVKESIRAFIAIPLPGDVKAQAREIQTQFRDTGLRLRWVKPHGIHLTLKFLGDIDRTQVPVVETVLQVAAGTSPPLNLAAKGIGVFPTVKKARVLWMGVAGDTPALHTFYGRLETQLETLGFKPEKRRFNAHLTLARAKGRLDPARLVGAMEAIGRFEPIRFEAREVVLYRSELKPDGAVYTKLAAVSFSNP